MNRATRFACFLLLADSPAAIQAQPSVYPVYSSVDNGARLGLTMEAQPYEWRGIKVLKITRVDPASPLRNIVVENDFLYGVDAYNLRSIDDLNHAIFPHRPGDAVNVYFLRARQNLAPMYVSINTISNPTPADYERFASPYLRSDQNVPQEVAGSTPKPTFCQENPWTCALGLAAGIAVAAKIVTSGSGAQTDNRQADRSDADSRAAYQAQEDARFANWTQRNRDQGLNDNGTPK